MKKSLLAGFTACEGAEGEVAHLLAPAPLIEEAASSPTFLDPES
ncbi:MAG TPA: hypothetical protein VIS09_16105 [Streptomyces sp.]